ncbi:hypothetical protein [Mycolicibacterium sphagni]|uniref:Uncharacterized protein n=1 Tax=Mycolicibacterium sphagni TaxID=1786 RepID=A0ABX2JVD4_9MYCO|nr:hypothetical protein [Mycolicibacterium sphagni]NTY60727.1 hypothetical protein [Mycolicibacterium sphagni]
MAEGVAAAVDVLLVAEVADVAELLIADDDEVDGDSSLPQPASTSPTARAAAVSGTTVRVRAESMTLLSRSGRTPLGGSGRTLPVKL